MANRILDWAIVNHRLDPHETELRIFVKLADVAPTTEIRGKLMGPRCVYASTIEIAYPMRQVQRSDVIELRVVIPESSWWDPESPFLYEGALELWQDGQSCGRVPVRHGIRTLQLTSKGFRLNGQPFTVRGKIVEPSISNEGARQLRLAGFNTVLTTVTDTGIETWDAADHCGLFVLGAAHELAPFLQYRNDVVNHPSNFGWVFSRADFLAGPCEESERAMLYGVNTSAASAPPNADFLVCHENELAWLDGVPLAKIVVTARLPQTPPTRPDVIGWLESP